MHAHTLTNRHARVHAYTHTHTSLKQSHEHIDYLKKYFYKATRNKTIQKIFDGQTKNISASNKIYIAKVTY